MGQHISRRKNARRLSPLTCEHAARLRALAKRPLASPHRAANWCRPSTISRELVATLARAAIATSKRTRRPRRDARGLGQAAQNDARFGGADRRKTDARAVKSRQISGRLAKDGVAFISHERIYQHVWKDKKDGGRCIFTCDTEAKNTTGARARIRGGAVPKRVDIDQRPPIVAAKSRIGAGRPTRLSAPITKALSCRTSSEPPNTPSSPNCRTRTRLFVQACARVLLPLADQIETITYDNGKEFASHAQIATSLGALSYLAKPYHSWECGLNEHTNGLFRQYFPRGSTSLFVRC